MRALTTSRSTPPTAMAILSVYNYYGYRAGAVAGDVANAVGAMAVGIVGAAAGLAGGLLGWPYGFYPGTSIRTDTLLGNALSTRVHAMRERAQVRRRAFRSMPRLSERDEGVEHFRVRAIGLPDLGIWILPQNRSRRLRGRRSVGNFS
jgi:hypothetical protein